VSRAELAAGLTMPAVEVTRELYESIDSLDER
jgi:hypothetical protein